jgi:hypothetical protein
MEKTFSCPRSEQLMSDTIRVVAYGMGVMGAGVVKALLQKKGFRLVGAVDTNPKLAEKDVAEELGHEKATGLKIEAVIAENETPSGLGPVPPGQVLGLRSVAHGYRGKDRAVSLEFNAHAGVAEEYDEVSIQGDPDVRQRILGGVHGDSGTIAMVINTIPRILQASPGLKTVLDLALPRIAP